jgi:hypothetical protein
MVVSTAAVKALGGALAVVILGSVGVWAAGRSIRNAVRDEVKLARLDSTRAKHDSAYVVDTIKYSTTRTRYDTLRRKVVLTDTQRVKETLAAADSALKQCAVVITSCEQRMRDRDSIIVELRKPPIVRRLTFPAEILYDPLRGESVLRGGTELRLFLGFSAKAEGELRVPGSAGLRVGLRKVF